MRRRLCCPLRGLARRVAEVVARLVERDDLFEKPGERPPQPPAFPREEAR